MAVGRGGSRRRTGAGMGIALPLAMLCAAAYFAFAAVQGEYGVFRHVELSAQREALQAELDALDREAAMLTDRTRRLSDDFLDLDLLDERSRLVLGLARADEIVVD